MILLIGGEIVIGIAQERQQKRDFESEQKVLGQLSTNTQATADKLASLQALKDNTGKTADTLNNLYSTTSAMSNSVSEEVKQAKLNTKSAERSANAAEASSKTAIDALHLSERAYVTVTSTLDAPPKTGQPIKVSIVGQNVGKTVATDVKMTSSLGIVLIDLPLQTVRDKSLALADKPVSQTVMFNQQSIQQSVSSFQPIPDNVIESIKNKSFMIYVFTDVTYRDAFGDLHHTHQCNFYDVERDALSFCTSLNSVD